MFANIVVPLNFGGLRNWLTTRADYLFCLCVATQRTMWLYTPTKHMLKCVALNNINNKMKSLYNTDCWECLNPEKGVFVCRFVFNVCFV